MTDEATELPVIPWMTSEFYAWLWWQTVERDGEFELPDVGAFTLHVENRIAFASQAGSELTAVFMRDPPPKEAQSALLSGRPIQELSLHLIRDDQSFFFTLKGPEMNFTGVKLPKDVIEKGSKWDKEGSYLIRLSHLSDLEVLRGALFTSFIKARINADWPTQSAALKEWALSTQVT